MRSCIPHSELGSESSASFFEEALDVKGLVDLGDEKLKVSGLK